MDKNLVFDITKALGYTENGGKPDLNNLKAGKTGELKSIFQYTPDTWKHVAQQFTGDVNLPLTPENESRVTALRVNKWLEEGRIPEQIFSMWNAGEGEPDAYKGTFSTGKPSTGINEKYGVKYDVPAYVQKGMKYLNEFRGGESGTAQSEASPSAPETGGDQHAEAVKNLVALANDIKKRPSATVQQKERPHGPNRVRGLIAPLPHTAQEETKPLTSEPKQA